MLRNESPVGATSSSAVGSDNKPKRRHHRRPRPKLSCAECRQKKLSCDRQLPCRRCIRSGKPELCSFAGGADPSMAAPAAQPLETPASASSNTELSDQVRELRSELAKLKSQLAIPSSVNGQLGYGSSQTLLPDTPPGLSHALGAGLTHPHISETQQHDPKEPISRPAQGYYRQHTLFCLFSEIPQLFQFIKETADEQFKPRNIALRKAKLTTADALNLDVARLDGLLPPDKDTEQLLLAYLQDFENMHRVVCSMFYHPLSVSEFVARVRASRNDSTKALVLAMITISVTMGSPDMPRPGSDISRVHVPYKRMLPAWIDACEKWLRLQGSKRRDLEFYQVSCLVYLAKRMNGIRKKRFWSETGALIQAAVMDGLHRDPSSAESPCKKEMKRRVWSTIRELDLQNSFEHGLPTLLHSLDSDVAAPANIEDENIREGSEAISASPSRQYRYTRASYQNLSAYSWKLRRDISRSLYGSGGSKPLSNEDILRYTEEISQAIDALPARGVEATERNAADRPGLEIFLLAKTSLICQLKGCILALHRHRIRRGSDSFSSLSESLCHATSKDMLSLSRAAAEAGLRSLCLLREDILTASLTITRISLQQPPAQPSPSTALLAGAMDVDSPSYDPALPLLGRCLPILEERYLRCFNSEPWCPLTMLGGIMLLKIHQGQETRQTAKSATAQRFLDLYYKHVLEQETALANGVGLATPFDTLVNFDFCDFDLGWDRSVGFDQMAGVE